MTAPNHLIGGFTFTGVFGSIIGLNILADWKYLIVIGFAALLPDIDHTKSIIGKIFYPIAKFLNVKYGHRTITHSLFFLFSTTFLIAAFQRTFFPSIPLTQLYFLAVLSHLIFDMMTVQGVPLFYPFIKNPCVIPGNPYMRLRTGDLRTETAVLCFFLVSAVFLKPLIKDGFWTSYNRLFGSMKHLESEFNKSNDLLLVNYSIQEGSDLKEGQGLCISTDGSKMVLLIDDRFETLPYKNQIVKEVIPEHTAKEFHFERKSFLGISIDSLFTEILQYRITALDIQANTKFRYETKGIWKNGTSLKLKYLNHIGLEEIERSKQSFESNPVINKLENQISNLKAEDVKANAEYAKARMIYEETKQKYASATNEIDREIYYEQNLKLKEPASLNLNTSKIKELEIKIKELEFEERLKYEDYKNDIADSKLKLSGYYERLIID